MKCLQMEEMNTDYEAFFQKNQTLSDQSSSTNY